MGGTENEDERLPPSAHRDLALAAQLLAGDEDAFTAFAREQHPVLVRFAAARLRNRDAIVEESVQEAWVVFLESLERYEGRSSLRTFLIGVLLNVLRNRARAEERSVPFSALGSAVDDEGPVVAPDRFHDESALWAGHWAAAPRRWDLDPVDQREMREALQAAIALLPDAQRDVLTLRDVLGWESLEVCEALGITDTHQRVLLHRARGKLRSALEARFGKGP